MVAALGGRRASIDLNSVRADSTMRAISRANAMVTELGVSQTVGLT
jgi:hypothetical protein